MNRLSKEALRVLMEKREGPCISLFMPTFRTSPETKQNTIRFKNLLREAEERLRTGGLRMGEVGKLLKPVKALLKNSLFWQHQSDGLALFISPGFFQTYHLPLHVDVLLVVTDRFHIKPLLHLVTREAGFYILTLSQNEVRLFECTQRNIGEVELKNVPRSLEEALQLDVPEKQLQFHTRTPGRTGARAAIFHGHGAGTDDAKGNILRYFHQVDHGLRELLREERTPVVLAGVDYLFPIYREANSFLHLMEKGIGGNPEGMKIEQLHEQAWSIVEPYHLKEEKEAAAQYRQWAGSERASNDLNRVVPASYDGRVDLLFVAVGIQQWGTYDPETLTVHVHPEAEPGDEDLLDFSALHTFLNGGRVYVVEPERVPDQPPLAALFRY